MADSPTDQARYWAIFWLDASSVATAEQGIIDIGRQCGIVEPSITTVKSWLASKSQRWLLIIDNADNLNIDYSDYMPSSKRGDVLFTTRNRDCLTYETVGSESLGDLELEHARELLLKATLIPKNQWKEEEQAALAVIETLGSHTLAIVQAGAFIRKKLCSLKGYPKVFQQQKAQLLKFHSEANLSTYSNVYATFEVSAEYLQESALSECMDALNLLHALAFMHNGGISEELFRRASDYAVELKTQSSEDEGGIAISARHVARLSKYLQQGWSRNLHVRLQWRKACAMLESLSLITLHEDGDSVNISTHPLIHAWAKERQDYQSQCIAWQSAATILALSCQGWRDFQSFFVYLQPHIRVCVSHQVERLTSGISDVETAQLLLQLAEVFYETEDNNSFASLVEFICFRLQDSDDVCQEVKEEVNTFTAHVLAEKGKASEAVLIYENVFEARARRLAEDDPKRLESQNDLAVAYNENEQIKEAVELLQHVVKVRAELPDNDQARLKSEHTLAQAYLANQQTDKTIYIFEQVFRVNESLSEDHPNRLASQHELARAYLANEQIDKAIKLLEHVVKIEEEKLPEDHLNRLASQHELARAFLADEQFDEAIKLLENVIKIEEKKLAENHLSRLTSQHELARAYLANKQIDEAVKLYEYVVKIEGKKLAENHPSRLTSQHELARAYSANKQVDEAMKLYEYVVKVREEKLAEDHPDRLSSQCSLGVIYLRKQQFNKALPVLEHVVKIRKAKLAEDHPHRVDSEQWLAYAYQAREEQEAR